MSIISENIQNRMWALNISQDQLAKMVGYAGKTSINRIVNGEQDPPLGKIEAFAMALKTTPAILCGWDIDEEDDGANGYDIQVLAARLKKKGFGAEVFSTIEEALDYIVRICAGKSVGTGNTTDLAGMELVERLKETNGYNLYASEIRKGREMSKKAITADVFITTVSAISYRTAEMVNICNNGSQIAGSLYYPDEILFIVGKNKIAPDLEGALERAKNVYIAKVAKTVGYRTPCAEIGKCADCVSPDRLCRTTCIYHNPPSGVLNTVILIDEIIGY